MMVCALPWIGASGTAACAARETAAEARRAAPRPAPRAVPLCAKKRRRDVGDEVAGVERVDVAGEVEAVEIEVVDGVDECMSKVFIGFHQGLMAAGRFGGSGGH